MCDPYAMEHVEARMGSLVVIEEFLGGIVGADITSRTIESLPERQYLELRQRLKQASFAGLPDNERAARWAAAANMPAISRIALSEWSGEVSIFAAIVALP